MDLPTMGLKENDRLEAGGDVKDIGDIESMTPPFTVFFWRRSDETLCRHRNPLWRTDLGMNFDACGTIDMLHAVHLGVMQSWGKVALWEMLLNEVYGHRADSDDRLANSCLVIRGALTRWLKIRRATYPAEVLTEVNDFTPSMVGTHTHPAFKLKGAETWCFALFLVHELELHGSRVGVRGPRLLMAGRCLVDIVMATRQHGWVMPPTTIEEQCCKKAYVRYEKM